MSYHVMHVNYGHRNFDEGGGGAGNCIAHILLCRKQPNQLWYNFQVLGGTAELPKLFPFRCIHDVIRCHPANIEMRSRDVDPCTTQRSYDLNAPLIWAVV